MTKIIVALILLYSLGACAAHYTIEVTGWSGVEDGRVIIHSTTETPPIPATHTALGDW